MPTATYGPPAPAGSWDVYFDMGRNCWTTIYLTEREAWIITPTGSKGDPTCPSLEDASRLARALNRIYAVDNY